MKADRAFEDIIAALVALSPNAKARGRLHTLRRKAISARKAQAKLAASRAAFSSKRAAARTRIAAERRAIKSRSGALRKANAELAAVARKVAA
jgi:hypothetical protein